MHASGAETAWLPTPTDRGTGWEGGEVRGSAFGVARVGPRHGGGMGPFFEFVVERFEGDPLTGAVLEGPAEHEIGQTRVLREQGAV